MALDTTDNSTSEDTARDARPSAAHRQRPPRRQTAAVSGSPLTEWCGWLAGLLGSRVSITVFGCAPGSLVRIEGVQERPIARDAVEQCAAGAATRGSPVQRCLTADTGTVFALAVPVRDRQGETLVVACVLPSSEPALADTAKRLIAHASHWLDASPVADDDADDGALLARLDCAPNITHAAQILVDALAPLAAASGVSPRLAYFSRAGVHGLRLRAISAQARPADDSAWLHSCRRVAREFLYQSSKTVGMLDATATATATAAAAAAAASDGLVRTQHLRHAAEFSCHRVMTIGLPSHAAEGCAVLIAEFPDDTGPIDATFRSWSDTVRRCGATLAWHERAARGLTARALQSLSPAFVWHRLRSNVLRNALILVALAALVAAATVTVPGS
ncbi:MAG: hypothetical protein AAF460_12950, partial [Pseudomonadota bacterium]